MVSYLQSLNLRRLMAVILVFTIIAAVFNPAMIRIGSWLNVSPLHLPSGTTADAIVILSGNTLKRMETAVALYTAGVATRMALTGYEPFVNDSAIDTALLAHDYAVNQGVPTDAFTLLEATSTTDDAQQIAAYIQTNDLDHVVVVSDWPHARRVMCTIRTALGNDSPQLYFHSAQDKFSPTDWWTQEQGLINVSNELIKMGFYALVHQVPMWNCYPGDANLLVLPILLGLSLLISFGGVELVRRNAARLHRIDMPNERSSHSVPTPRGGGLGIVVTVLLLWLAALMLGWLSISLPIALAYAVAAGLIAVVGWMDDRYSLSAGTRLLPYLLIGSSFALFVGIFTRLDVPLIGEMTLNPIVAGILTIFWIVGFLNIFNFMDGIDGLAGSQALLAGLFWWVLLMVEGQFDLALLAGLVAMASQGFLFHNMPPARIFMGDVGSVFLGFTLAVLPLLAYLQTGNSRLPVIGVLFVAPFVLDGILTIIRRALRHENIFRPHRSHLYQRLVIAGQSHQQVTGLYRLLMLLGGVCGLIYYTGTMTAMSLAFLTVISVFTMHIVYVGRVQSHAPDLVVSEQ
jgi:UDP-N-acetylmuramyl pentapeptide phosphotransferase/UDP-N-acetylglucosamine-1-phosphate transferase/uncharacterized SAM-binding protein YcdF (DUF218 family)